MNDLLVDFDLLIICFNWLVFSIQFAGAAVGGILLFSKSPKIERRTSTAVTQVSVTGVLVFLILEFTFGGFLAIKPIHFKVAELTGTLNSGWIETVMPQVEFSSRDILDHASNRFAITVKQRSGKGSFDEMMMQRLISQLRDTASDDINSSGKFRNAQTVTCELQTWNGIRGVRLTSKGTLIEGNIENCILDQFVVVTSPKAYYLNYLMVHGSEANSSAVLDSILKTIAIEN